MKFLTRKLKDYYTHQKSTDSKNSADLQLDASADRT